MMKRIGLIGISDGNGHPFSWGAITNGYDDECLKEANWDIIYQYVKKRDISEFGFNNCRITHVWTQNIEISNSLMKSIKADKVVENYLDMLPEIDALIIARDDFESHLEMAKPFLEAGKKVLIDKPLTLNLDELIYFNEFLQKGQLMSVAGLRFAKELDEIKSSLSEFGKLKLIQTSVIVNWDKYGIHLIDGVLSIVNERPISITYTPGNAELFTVRFESGLIWTLNILGDAPKTFNIQVWGEDKRVSIEIEDNFSMFRRLLFRFTKLVTENELLYKPNNTLISIGLLIAGKKAKEEQREVSLDEIYFALGIGEER